MSETKTALRVDAHTHLVSPDLGRYPLRVAPPPAPLPADTAEAMVRQSPEDFLRMLEHAGLDRAVVVHSFGAYEFDCAYALAAGAADPGRLRVVVQYDTGPDFGERLKAAAEIPFVKGVRVIPMFYPSLMDESQAAVWDVIAEAGMTVEVVAASSAGLERVLDRLAPLPVVLHGVRLSALSGPVVEGLLARGNAYFKISSNELLRADAESGDPAPLMEGLAARLGAERLVWGSNYPQTTDRPYQGLVDLALQATRGLSSADRDAILGGTAMKLWPW